MLHRSKWSHQEIAFALEEGLDDYHSIEAQRFLRLLSDYFEPGTNPDETWRQFVKISSRLIKGKPLSPINNVDDIWQFEYIITEDGEDLEVYTCTRYPALYKYVTEKGETTYSDLNRVIVSYAEAENTFVDAAITDLIDKKIPITFPYTPYSQTIRVEFKEESERERLVRSFVLVRGFGGREYNIDTILVSDDSGDTWYEN